MQFSLDPLNRRLPLEKKGIAIWHFSTLTFTALVHLIDAAATVLFNS